MFSFESTQNKDKVHMLSAYIRMLVVVQCQDSLSKYPQITWHTKSEDHIMGRQKMAVSRGEAPSKKQDSPGPEQAQETV